MRLFLAILTMLTLFTVACSSGQGPDVQAVRSAVVATVMSAWMPDAPKVADCAHVPAGYPETTYTTDGKVVQVSLRIGQTRDDPGTTVEWDVSDCEAAQIDSMIEVRRQCLQKATVGDLAEYAACLELQGE
jgi:hypothetical protein